MMQREPGVKRFVWWTAIVAIALVIGVGVLFVLSSWVVFANSAFIVKLNLPAGFAGPVRVSMPAAAPANHSWTTKRVSLAVAADGTALWPEAVIGDRWVEWQAWDARAGRLPQYVIKDPANNPAQRALWVLSVPTNAGTAGEFFIGTEAEFMAYPGNTLLGPRRGVRIGPN